MTPRVLVLSDLDNVGVAMRPLSAGERVQIGSGDLLVLDPIPAYHKLALRPIPAGAKVIKYGAAIGTATRAIAPGQHVHSHNLRGDYLADDHSPPDDGEKG